jgi:hypothetical protein
MGNTFAKLFDRCVSFYLFDLKMLPCCSRLKPLPRKRSFQKVNKHVVSRLQVISPALLMIWVSSIFPHPSFAHHNFCILFFSLATWFVESRTVSGTNSVCWIIEFVFSIRSCPDHSSFAGMTTPLGGIQRNLNFSLIEFCS